MDGVHPVSVVIPTVDGFEMVRDCAATLPEACGPLPCELIVVDNGSRDGAAFESIPGARVIHHRENLGFARGVNSGVRAARGDLILVLNNDTLCTPGMIERMARALTAHDNVALVGPLCNIVKARQRLPIGDEGLTAAGRATIAAVLAQGWDGVVDDVEDLSGVCMLGRAADWRDDGLFDEGYPVGNFEDDDLCLRWRRRGRRLLLARDAYLHHLGSRTFRAIGEDYDERYQANYAIFTARWGQDPIKRAAVLLDQGAAGQALASAEEAVRRMPQCPDSWQVLADAQVATGRKAEAIASFERFLQACPLHPMKSVQLGLLLLEQGRGAEGVARLQWTRAHCRLPEEIDFKLLAQLGDWHVEHGQPDEAERCFTAALASPDLERWARHGLGLCHLVRGRWRDAENAFRAALTPDDPKPWMNLGIVLWQQGHADAAEECLARAVTLAPDWSAAQDNLRLVRRARPERPAASGAPASGRAATQRAAQPTA